MKRKELLKNLKSLGYPLFDTDASLEVYEAISELVKARDVRLWEGFPLVLANVLKRGLFDYKNIAAYFTAPEEELLFRNLVLMSIALYEYLKIDFPAAGQLKEKDFFDAAVFNRFLGGFENKGNLSGITGLSAERVLNIFELYFDEIQIKDNENEIKEYMEIGNKFDLDYSMSQIFSAKQKELLVKRLKGEKMSKTEQEYFSRRVKKKVLALANADLHKLAVTLIRGE